MGPRTITGSRFDLLTHYGSPYSCSPPRHLIDNDYDGRLCWPNNCTRVSDKGANQRRRLFLIDSRDIIAVYSPAPVCTQRGHVVQVLSGIDVSRWAIVGALLAAINCGPNEMLIAFFSRIFCPRLLEVLSPFSTGHCFNSRID